MKIKIAALILAGLVLVSCQPIQVIYLINEERHSQNLRPLESNSNLTVKAKGWSETIAAEGRLVHSNLASELNSGWHIVGENLAVASSIEQAHALLMESPPHRANILNPRYTHVGIGVTEVNGFYWIVQVFAA